MNSVQNTTPVTENTENRGRLVIATLFGGGNEELRVWEEIGDTIYLCSERCYKQLISGDTYNQPIGYPRSAVAWA